MRHDEVDAFLREPRIADLATVKPDGAPHVAPVWFHYDGEKLFVIARPSAVKLRNIANEPRVSLSIATPNEPYRYVVVTGTAEVSAGGAAEVFRAMAVHYKGRVEGERYVKRRLAEAGYCLITITPSKLIAWAEEEA